MRLAAQPGHQGVGAVVIALGDETAVGADRDREHRRVRGHIRQAALQQGVDVDALLRRRLRP